MTKVVTFKSEAKAALESGDEVPMKEWVEKLEELLERSISFDLQLPELPILKDVREKLVCPRNPE